MAVRRFINHSIYLLFVLLISSVLIGCSPSKPSDETISAARQGDAQAQYEYGMYLYELADEAPLYDKEGSAMVRLLMGAAGTSEYVMKSLKGYYDEAREWLIKAGDQGHSEALYQLGMMSYRFAEEYQPERYSNIDKDETYRIAAHYFHQSGEIRAWWRLGNCYLLGKGESKSLFKAACYYTGFLFWLGVYILLLPFKIIGYIYHLIF